MAITITPGITFTDITIQPAAYGETVYTTAGTYSWVAPDNVYSVSVVCVGGGAGGDAGNLGPGYSVGSGGGGALAWKNNISVVPGQSYTVTVGAAGLDAYAGGGSRSGGDSWFVNTSTVLAEGGEGVAYNPWTPSRATYIGDGGGNGGSGAGYEGFGGGGAGGYTGNGGDGGGTGSDFGDGTGGGYAGGMPETDSGAGAGGGRQMQGGGVGIYGKGADGTAPGRTFNVSSSTWTYYAGTAGSPNGTAYGWGAPGGTSHSSPNSGGSGAVRIVWGEGRSFPSTNVG